MFPNLQFLLLANNQLYSSAPQPALLPRSWTQPTYPIAFPQLSQLVLFPGNDNLCRYAPWVALNPLACPA